MRILRGSRMLGEIEFLSMSNGTVIKIERRHMDYVLEVYSYGTIIHEAKFGSFSLSSQDLDEIEKIGDGNISTYEAILIYLESHPEVRQRLEEQTKRKIVRYLRDWI